MEHFSRYTIERKLDAGGMATVYLALDTVLQRKVALKTLHPHLMDQAATIKRFENEAHAIANLSHDNIIKLFDFGEEDGRRFLVMEYIDGITLHALLEQNRTLPNLVLLSIFQQIFSGLAAAHEQGICHRDVKPSNIMVDWRGAVRIMDFGIAHLVNQESLTMTGTFIGSPHYISPEQARSKEIHVATDVFSAGSVMYQCATGELPFPGSNPHAVIFSILHDTPQRADLLNAALLPAIADLVTRCHALDASRRPDALECVRAIEECLTHYSLVAGRSRITRFLRSASVYVPEEERELHTLFRTRALEKMKKGQFASALKQFHQAQAFGPLPVGDQRVLQSISRRATLQKAVLRGAGLLAVGLLLVFLLPADLFFAKQSNVLTPMPSPGQSTRQVVKEATTIKPESVEIRSESDSLASGNVAESPVTGPDFVSPENGFSRAPSSKPVRNAFVTIKTRPPFARVYIDGAYRGKTMLQNMALAAGSHELKILQDNGPPFDSLLQLHPGDSVTVMKNLVETD